MQRKIGEHVQKRLVNLAFGGLQLTKDQMEEFKQCWKRQGNDERVSTKNA